MGNCPICPTATMQRTLIPKGDPNSTISPRQQSFRTHHLCGRFGHKRPAGPNPPGWWPPEVSASEGDVIFSDVLKVVRLVREDIQLRSLAESPPGTVPRNVCQDSNGIRR